MQTSAAPQSSTRILSIDVLRGLTIAAMILVTDPGTYSAVYWPLLHAQWANPTPTDLIFPSFLMMTGASMPFSFAARERCGEKRALLAAHVLRRALTLIVLGLLLNAFPAFDLHNLRLPGILQRIAICYILASTLYIPFRNPRTRVVAIFAAVAALLIGYWALLRFVPVPGFGAGHLDSFRSLPSYVDRVVFPMNHLWPYGTTPGHGVTFDPEGVLSTLPALATMLMGTLAGECFRSNTAPKQKVIALAIGGLIALALGLAWNPTLPLIKKIWTSSFALWSGGIVMILLAVLCYCVDVKRWRRGLTPMLIFGTNPIVAFTISTVITSLGYFLHTHTSQGVIPVNQWVFERCFLPLASLTTASLIYAIAIVTLNLALVYSLYRKRIFVRI